MGVENKVPKVPKVLRKIKFQAQIKIDRIRPIHASRTRRTHAHVKDNPVNSSISSRGLLVALLRSDISIELPIPLTRILSGAHIQEIRILDVLPGDTPVFLRHNRLDTCRYISGSRLVVGLDVRLRRRPTGCYGCHSR